MEYNNWLKFASIQNGQNTRLVNVEMDLLTECINKLQMLPYADDRELVKRMLSDVIYDLDKNRSKVNKAIEVNNRLKQIIKDDYGNPTVHRFKVNKVTKFEDEKSRVALVNLYIPDGVYSIRDTFILDQWHKFRILEFYKSLGLTDKDGNVKMDWDNLEGKTGRVLIQHKRGVPEIMKYLK